MKENKLPIIFFSLIFSILVWVSVNLGNRFQTSIEIPVQIENIQSTMGVAIPLPERMRLTIQGTGWQLLNAVLTPNLRYNIDFTSISRNDTVFTYKDLSTRVNLPSELRVVETSPETVVVKLDQKITKNVLVRPLLETNFREGFGIVGPIKTEPESLSISGAAALLRRITSWPTQSIVLSDVNAPVSVTVPMQDTLQFEIERSRSTVRVSFDVQPIAEKTIDNIPIEMNQVPEYRSVILIPPTISVIIRSGVNTITPLTEKDFYAFIDYKSILLDTSGTIKPSILGPSNVRIVQQNPERIQYVVRK